MRQITTHHDGHRLNESIIIRAGEPGPGGASHRYVATAAGEGVDPWDAALDPLAIIQYQVGPPHVEGSTPGILDGVLLAIVRDRMEAFQAGPYASDRNAQVLAACDAGLAALKARADERAARGALGTYQK